MKYKCYTFKKYFSPLFSHNMLLPPTQSLASSLNQSFFCKIFSFIEVLFFRQSSWTWNIKLCMLQLWSGLLLEWVMKRGKNKCVDLIANFGMQNSKRNIICHYLLSLTALGWALKLRTFCSLTNVLFHNSLPESRFWPPYTNISNNWLNYY
jgi:hypothetical protein